MNVPFDWAQTCANNAMRDLNIAATSIEKHLTDGGIIPAHVEKLQAPIAQLWAMEDLAREAERELSRINAEYRTGSKQART